MTKEITLNHITKIEGHAKLDLAIEKGVVTKCELGASEGARYFEGIVRGRRYTEPQEITSRICGICSCAHVIAAVMAVEDAIDFTPSPQTVRLRELLMLGERIRSHATHLYFLALPDYLGYESALAMAKEYKPQLQDALSMMKVGNHIITTLGARDLHPVSIAVGGWLKLPKQEQLTEIAQMLDEIRPAAERTCDLFNDLDYPEFESEGEWFALVHPDEFALLFGTFTGQNSQFEKNEYRTFVSEYHREYSSANFVVADDHRYSVGALPRINHSHEKLWQNAKDKLYASGMELPCKNPYKQNIAQAVEILHCLEHAKHIATTLTLVPEKIEVPPPKAGTGVGCVEVPRGTLWHEYTIDENGIITDANIITPTAQNLLNIQEDIRLLVPQILDLEKEEIVMDIEKLIRSHDPCFSCSAHFLEVNWDE